MTKHISIGKVHVPIIDYAVGAAAVLGIRDSGKTVTSKGIAEQLLDNNIPVVIFDAVGKWRWMKVPGSLPNAKGYKIVVAGGRNPDLPLTPHSVPEIVRSALKERIPLIIDLFDKNLSKAEWRRIVQQAIRIIHYENEGGPVHVFLEEAAEFVPQKVMDGEVYAEVEKLVRMGGNAQVGITIINQRSQEVNKAVLDQCTSLILGCQVGSKAIEAVEKWVDRLDPDTADAVTQSLPRLGPGEAWVWTRQNPDRPCREKLPMCRSFHPDRRTPDAAVDIKKLGGANIEEFVGKLSSSIPKVIEEAKANDPAELKRKLRETEQKLRLAEQKAPAVQQSEPEKVYVITQENEHKIAFALKAVEDAHNSVTNQFAGIRDDLATLLRDVRVVISNSDNAALRRTKPALMQQVKSVLRSPVTPQQPSPSSNGTLDGAQHNILNTVGVLRLRGLVPNREMIARWLDIHPNGGRYGSNLALLRAEGYLEGCELTKKGQSAASPVLQTGLEGAKSPLSGTQREIIDLLAGGGTYTRETLAEALGKHPNGGRYGSDLARLRTMGLIPERGEIKLTEAAYL